jgi:hypothetical protein
MTAPQIATCQHGIAHDSSESNEENCEQCDARAAVLCSRCGVARYEHTVGNYFACFEFTEEGPA